MVTYAGLGGQVASSKTVTATYGAIGTSVGVGTPGNRGGKTSLSITNSTAIGSYSCAVSIDGSTDSYLILIVYLSLSFQVVALYSLIINIIRLELQQLIQANIIFD